jgi:lactoylglutathione lyase
MAGVAFNLVVIRAADIERSRRFYSALGLKFFHERHGKGLEHYAAQVGGIVFEIYPHSGTKAVSEVRLGFRVSGLERVLAELQALGAEVISPAQASAWGFRAVVIDPYGGRVELVEEGSVSLDPCGGH